MGERGRDDLMLSLCDLRTIDIPSLSDDSGTFMSGNSYRCVRKHTYCMWLANLTVNFQDSHWL
jgi:hypothetical protein